MGKNGGVKGMPCCNAGNTRRLSLSWCPDTTYRERERDSETRTEKERDRHTQKEMMDRWTETKKGQMRQNVSEMKKESQSERERDM